MTDRRDDSSGGGIAGKRGKKRDVCLHGSGHEMTREECSASGGGENDDAGCRQRRQQREEEGSKGKGALAKHGSM